MNGKMKVFLVASLFVALVSLACGSATPTPSVQSPYMVPMVSYAEIASALENSTDLQWKEYVKKTVGNRFHYSGRIISVNENLNAEIYNDDDRSTVVISNIPHNIAITLYVGQRVDGDGIINNIYDNGFMNHRAALNVEYYPSSFVALPSPTPWDTIECSDITQAHKDLTDSQWGEYKQSAQGQPIHFTGEISLILPSDGKVSIDDSSCPLEHVYLVNVPDSIINNLFKGQSMEGYGTIEDIVEILWITIDIDVDPTSLIIHSNTDISTMTPGPTETARPTLTSRPSYTPLPTKNILPPTHAGCRCWIESGAVLGSL